MKDLKAIGIENQINDALFGPSDNQIKLVKQKIDFVKRNASKVIKVNGDKVYDVIIDEDNIRYNLLKCPAEFKANNIAHFKEVSQIHKGLDQ
jgi:hypothetical protein